MLHTRALVYRRELLRARTKTDKRKEESVTRTGENRTEKFDRMKHKVRLLALLHGIDQLKQLAAIHDFNKWLAHFIIRHYIYRRGVIETYAIA